MIYRIDSLAGENIGSFCMALMLTDCPDYQKLCGSGKEGVYTVKISRAQCKDWELAVGDFIGFCEANGKDAVLVMTETELYAAKMRYEGHRYNEPVLRSSEPVVLLHSTPLNSWKQIHADGMLKSWNRLKAEKMIGEEHPIGFQLGDPEDFSDYIMFGGGVTGEIVVNSKQRGKIVMDGNAEYLTGARLYFDARRIAQDGLLLRDGCHLKVKDSLPLFPYLIWAATWENVGLTSQISTPKLFSKQADRKFQALFQQKLEAPDK